MVLKELQKNRYRTVRYVTGTYLLTTVTLFYFPERTVSLGEQKAARLQVLKIHFHPMYR